MPASAGVAVGRGVFSKEPMMSHRTFAVLVLSLSVFACKKEERHDPLALPPAATPEPAKPKKSVAELLSPKAPTFPAVFNGVTPGMTVEEARKKIPALDKELSFALPDYDTRASLRANDDKRIQSMHISGGKESVGLATAAWGKPTTTKELHDTSVWFNPEAKVRAKIDSTYEDYSFDSYIPAAELLGSDKAGPAFQKAHPLIGMTADEVRKNYAANILEMSAEKNAAKNAEVEAFAGKKLDLGKSEATIDLLFPPTEYEMMNRTKVNLHFKKGKVDSYTFDIAYEPFPKQMDDVLALTTKTYGKPKVKKEYSHIILFFRKAPTVKLEDDTITKRLTFTVEK